MIKRLFITIAVCFFVISSYGQTDRKNLVGTHFTLGGGAFSQPGWDGGAGYDVKYYYGIGLDYSRILSKHWDVCSGIEYTYSDMTTTPAPGLDLEQGKDNLKVVTIPAQVKFHFLKYFFVNGGLFFNVTSRMGQDSWYGGSMTNKLNMFLGCGLGVGFQYEFNPGIVLSLNLSDRWNGLENIKDGNSFLKFLQVKGNIPGYRFFQEGVSLGIGYKF